MSHSTVLVIGAYPERQLAPFNEQPYRPSPYLEFQDEEDEYLKQYETETVTKVILEDGTLVNTWDNRFNVGTGLFDTKTVIPEHLEQREVPYKELYPTFEEFMAEWCGFEKGRDPEKSRFGSWRNPKAKWDWFALGGRWSNKILLKPDAPLIVRKAKLSDYGFMKTANEEEEKRVEEAKKERRADQALKGDIDFERMENIAVEKAHAEWDNWVKFLNGRVPHRSWAEIRDECRAEDPAHGIDKARDLYGSQELVKEAKTPAGEALLGEYYPFDEGIDEFLVGEERYIDLAFKSAFSTFAVLKDGVWYERGEMGWWGTVGNEKDQDAWADEFHKLIADLPDDALLSVYDVHI